jgi:hypothetical protein
MTSQVLRMPELLASQAPHWFGYVKSYGTFLLPDIYVADQETDLECQEDSSE